MRHHPAICIFSLSHHHCAISETNSFFFLEQGIAGVYVTFRRPFFSLTKLFSIPKSRSRAEPLIPQIPTKQPPKPKLKYHINEIKESA